MKLEHIKSKILDYMQSPQKIALSLALIFGVISAIVVPQMTVNDEGAHFLKAYSLSSGNLAGATCSFPTEIINKAGSVSNSLSSGDLIGAPNYSQIKETTCGSAGNYSPIMHLPQALGIGVGRMTNASVDGLVLLGRIANAVFYAISLYLIVRLAKNNKWVYVVIGLFPIMIHTAGSLSGDVMNNVVVMGSLAYIFNLFLQNTPLKQRQIITLLIITALLALTKATNIILLLPLAALPTRLFSNKPNEKSSITNFKKWIIVSLCALMAIAIVLLAQKLLGSALFFREPVENPLTYDPLRFFYIMYNTYINPALGYGDLLIRGIVGEFSSFKYHLPTAIVFIEITLLTLTLFLGRTNAKQIQQKELVRLAALSSLALALFVTAITYALYSAWAIQPDRLGTGAIYADGVQGRYFTAALVALIPIGVLLRNYIHIETKSKTLLGHMIFYGSTFCLLFYILETFLIFT